MSMLTRHLILALAFAAIGCGPANDSPTLAATSGDWREFEGSWNAAGARKTICARRGSARLDRRAARARCCSTGAGRPGVGFHSEVIGLTDSATGFVGRSVWTDEHGDQVYSELQGEGTAAKNHISGNDPLRHGALRRRDGHATSSPGNG